ncbi:hypothetical protein [Mesorhizobium amorphae]|uniref:hypothetical protein n=1 Tax=Mesorhizobium amorphae TaxID=71433 RepID=UPI001181F9E8|nr:hypothetical protein [Mesorhizobium amorphae]
MAKAPLGKRAKCIANNASRQAIRDQLRIAGQTRHLATLMKLLHGGEWWTQVDHSCGLILVARRDVDDQPIVKSSLREVV